MLIFKYCVHQNILDFYVVGNRNRTCSIISFDLFFFWMIEFKELKAIMMVLFENHNTSVCIWSSHRNFSVSTHNNKHATRNWTNLCYWNKSYVLLNSNDQFIVTIQLLVISQMLLNIPNRSWVNLAMMYLAVIH